MIILCMIIVFNFFNIAQHQDTVILCHTQRSVCICIKNTLVRQKMTKKSRFVLCCQSIGALDDVMGLIVVPVSLSIVPPLHLLGFWLATQNTLTVVINDFDRSRHAPVCYLVLLPTIMNESNKQGYIDHVTAVHCCVSHSSCAVAQYSINFPHYFY